MRPPIIVDDNGDMVIFESLDEAQKYIEPTDVDSGDCLAFDSEGRLLRAEVVTRALILRRVRLQPAEQEPTHAGLLRSRLVEFFERLGHSRAELETEALEQLIVRGLKRLKAVE